MAGLTGKQMIEAGEIDKVRAEAERATSEKFKPLQGQIERLTQQLYDEKVGGAFARSKFIAEKMILPGDLARPIFGQHFKIEGGDVVALDGSGNKIFSRVNPGQAAGFDEAMEMLVGSHPQRDTLMRASGATGGGAMGGTGAAGAKAVTRGQFDAMSPAAKMDYVRNGGAVTD